MSTPSSMIHICSGVLLTNDYTHTIWFDDLSSQLSYFSSKVVKTFSAYTYIRKSWSLKVEANMEQARTWSYLYFQNGNGKTYFYFINNIEYINDNTVELFIELDVMQTYLNEYTLHRCFVEREHSATDSIGDNVIEENLELGEFVTASKVNIDMQDMCILILTSIDLISREPLFSTMSDGVFSGLGLFAVDSSRYKELAGELELLDEEGKSDAIVSMWMYPKNLVSLKSGSSWDGAPAFNYVTETGGKTYNTTVPKPNGTHNYTPRNKKLCTYPFNFLYVSNNSGAGAVYRYERFGGASECQLRVCGVLSPDGAVKLIPVNYNNVIVNYDEGVMGGSYPTCAWNQDIYKLWLAQNQNSMNHSMNMAGLTILGGVASIALSPFTGGFSAIAGLGGIVSGASQIASTLAAKSDKEIQPPQAKGNYSGNLNIAMEHHTFTLMHKSVDKAHAQIIDDYFDMYGYQTNRVKIPNRNVRKHWTYTKTLGCHVSGSLCTEDLRKIQSIYDNGITFWKNGDNIGAYDLAISNTCL